MAAVTPWKTLATVVTDEGPLELRQRGAKDFLIVIAGRVLMTSRERRSEEAVAALACTPLASRKRLRVLIGGLGMGFTLAAARAAFPASTAIVVAELVPRVVAWARGVLASVFGDSLSDPRVSIEIADVHDVIVSGPARYDAILLDVDNGPDGLIQLANDRLYCDWGLRAAYDALRPAGILAVWSSFADDAFGDRLRAAQFDVETVSVHGGGRSTDSPHTIWIARKTALQSLAVLATKSASVPSDLRAS